MKERLSFDDLSELFIDLLALPETDRQQTLNALHQDDRLLLQNMLRADADPESDFLDEPAALHAQLLKSDQDVDIDPESLIGKQFGAFRLKQLLGQGGMATVFLAERVDSDFDQVVAIKLLRRGLFSSMEQKLFRRERRLLAQLDHPNIPRLIDGGVTDAGIPYLVLELVEGIRIDQFAILRRLSLKNRLELFVTTCRAVSYAHQALVIHRDIKPSNILVTEDGTPKLLDFGIAKLLDESDSTSTGHSVSVALTPAYAAPEQLRGDPVTTATDVYALGVVLHELLTGQRPNTTDTAVSNVVDTSRLSRPDALPLPRNVLRRALRGDLDNIVARAICAEPERRYHSVDALIADLENHLDGKPVSAHPNSSWYRVRKFVQRNRAIVAITMTFSLAVVGSLGVAVLEAQTARAEAQRANIVRNFLVELLDTARAELPPDEQPTPVALVNKAAQQLAANEALPELARADVLQTLGQISSKSGSNALATKLFEQAYAIRARELGADHPDTLSTLTEMMSIQTSSR